MPAFRMDFIMVAVAETPRPDMQEGVQSSRR